jgi:hypothetical protein
MSRLVTTLFLGLGITLAGCGTSNSANPDGGDPTPTSDAGSPDAEGPCDRSGFVAAAQSAEAEPGAFYYGAASAEGAPYDFLAIELYYGLGGAEPLKGPGTSVIGADPANRDYATCSTCVLAYAGCDDTDTCARVYLATAGTLTVSAMSTGGRFAGSVTGLRLVEVTMDPDTYATTPVAGGETWCVPTLAFDTPIEGMLPCSTSADCAVDAGAPYCHVESSVCVQCLEESHCAGTAATPHCDGASLACVECVTDAHCGANPAGGFCNAGLCGACASAFDCATAAAPACLADGASGRAVCRAPAACAGDDGAANQGPAAARMLMSGSLAGKVCDAAGQSDWFVFHNPGPGDVSFTLAWSIGDPGNAEDLDLVVYDASGAVLGESYLGSSQEAVALTYLGAGAVYARVTAYSTGATAGAVPYTLGVARVASSCAADADCAAVYAHQRLRGHCSGGACVAIAGGGALAAGAACDSPDDCASGLCTYGGSESAAGEYTVDYYYLEGAASRAYCVAARCGDEHPCDGGKVCSLGYCLPPCTSSAQCPIIAGGGDVVPIDGWAHARCDTASGECRY